jgi:hypothetical protein
MAKYNDFVKHNDFVGLTNAEPREVTAIDVARETMAFAAELSQRAQKIAGRLLGPVAETQGKPDIKSVCSGVLDDLRDVAETTRRSLSEGMEALNRIDRSI